jgi:hypothetical protein
MLAGVSTPAPRLVVELGQDTDSFDGLLRDDDGTERPFSSWLEFLSLVEAWRVDHAPETQPREVHP